MASSLLERLTELLRTEVDPAFTFCSLGPLPWTTPALPVASQTVALITTGGLHLKQDAPFEAHLRREGDASFRTIPRATTADELCLQAPYVDSKYTPRDSEVALPLLALEEEVQAQTVGASSARHYSFVGGVIRPLPGLAVSAKALVPLLQQDEVDTVVLLPTCSICVQSTTILARELEAAGFCTVTLTLLPELTERLGAPRSLALHFPFGAPAGDPGNRHLHRAVLREALACVEETRTAGAIRTSNLAWRNQT